jgi:hypothetical protein
MENSLQNDKINEKRTDDDDNDDIIDLIQKKGRIIYFPTLLFTTLLLFLHVYFVIKFPVKSIDETCHNLMNVHFMYIAFLCYGLIINFWNHFFPKNYKNVITTNPGLWLYNILNLFG